MKRSLTLSIAVLMVLSLSAQQKFDPSLRTAPKMERSQAQKPRTPMVKPQSKSGSTAAATVKKKDLSRISPPVIKAMELQRQEAFELQEQSSRLSYEKKAANLNGKVRVIFIVDSVWKDGSGYHLLLDADRTMYDSLFELIRYPISDQYDAFEYVLPEGAFPAYDSPIVLGRQDTLEFDPGRFDMFIVNPDVDQIYFAAGPARYKDVYFQGDFEYKFSVSLNTSIGNDQVLMALKHDFAIGRINNTGYFEAPTDIEVMLANLGTATHETPLKIWYQINDGDTKETAVTTPPAPGKQVKLKLGTEDLTTAGEYKIKIWMNDTEGWSPSNDTLNFSIWSLAPRSIPYVEQFNNRDMGIISNEWLVMDVNEDNTTWKISTDDYNKDTASRSMTYAYNAKNPANDILISPRLNTPAGKYTLLYRAKGKNANYSEELVILKNSIPSEEGAVALDTVTIEYTNWKALGAEFTVENDGLTYILFKAISPKDQYGLFIDEVYVFAGPASENYQSDLRIENIIPPYSSCDLGTEESVKVIISNYGIIPAEGVDISLKLDQNSTITEAFEDSVIDVNGQMTFTLDAKFDLSTLGVHKFIGLASSLSQHNSSSPIHSDSVFTLEKVELPILTDYADSESVQWYSEIPGGWKIDQEMEGILALKEDVTLVSPCFDLTKDMLYRITLEYMGGFEFIWQFIDNFEVLIGKSGSDISTWTSLGEVNDILSTDIEVIDFDFSMSEAGSYVAGIRSTTVPSSLYFFSISIESVSDYDVRVNSLRYNVPATVPAHFLTKDGYKILTTVENRGSQKAEGVAVKLSADDVLVSTSPKTTLNRGSLGEVSNSLKFSETDVQGLKGLLELNLEATFDKEDLNPDDNTSSISITIGDTVLARDRSVDFTNGVGSSSPVTFGNLFYVSVEDTLSGINIGFGGDKIPALDFKLNVYTSTSDDFTTLVKKGKKILTTTLSRPEFAAEGAIVYFPVRPLILPAGHYFFEVEQLTGSSALVMFDEDPQGFFFIQATDTTSAFYSDFGNLAIRPVFGKKTELVKKDISIVSIDKPEKTRDVYAANEKIEATVKNVGMSAITDSIRIRCRVGDQVKEIKIGGLAANATGTASFEMDLSTPGKYQIMVYSGLEGDEFPSNDTVKLDVTCLSPEINPYKMDFESCADFAISDFSPAWTTVDVNGALTYGVQLADETSVTFPGAGEAHAFMAFNPSATTPSYIGSLEPHDGDRVGVCFGEREKNADGVLKNNDWIISPKLLLGTQSKFTFWASTTQYPESFQIWVSTTDNQLSSFTKLGDEETHEELPWTLFEYDLSEYDGQSVYVAIQCVSEDAFMFNIDDLEVVTVVGNQDQQVDQFVLYPNPAKDFLMIYQPDMNIREVQIFDAMGREVFRSGNIQTATYRINTQGFSKGLYLVRIHSANGVSTQKVLVE